MDSVGSAIELMANVVGVVLALFMGFYITIYIMYSRFVMKCDSNGFHCLFFIPYYRTAGKGLKGPFTV